MCVLVGLLLQLWHFFVLRVLQSVVVLMLIEIEIKTLNGFHMKQNPCVTMNNYHLLKYHL